MKLKNKISGEIKEFALFDGKGLQGGATLKSLMEEWEDYEEPKEYWFIDSDGEVNYDRDDGTPFYNNCKEIGNYFKTQEEAEQAVEKLKAFKRLKDNGLEIKGWKFTPDMRHIKGNFVKVEVEIPYIVGNEQDLDLLFCTGEKKLSQTRSLR